MMWEWLKKYFPEPTPDEKLAMDVKVAADNYNRALDAAESAGLSVNAYTSYSGSRGRRLVDVEVRRDHGSTRY